MRCARPGEKAMTRSLDPRLTPARPDLAAAHLKGRVEASRYVVGTEREVQVPRAPLTARPDDTCSLSSELLAGERFTVYEERDGWAWGQADSDGYVGYLPAEALGPCRGQPTHRLSALLSHIYPEPDLKSRPLQTVYMGSPLTCTVRLENNFVALEGGGWIFADHLTPAGRPWGDPVGVARLFLGAPYLWGGRTAHGIDCSGLVQIALTAAGLSCPRDTDMQADALELRLPADTVPGPGDIVFFPGHVGFMVDGENLLHANATHMAVTIDPLSQVVEIVARETDRPPITCLVRLPAQEQA